MKESNWSLSKIILVITLAMLCFTLSCQRQDTEADIAAIKEVLNQYVIACNTGDFDLWISLWADDAVQMPPDENSVIGKEQIREANKPGFDQMEIDIAITNMEDIKVYGDLGLTHCNYTLAVTPKVGGETVIVMPDGKVLTLYARQSDGSWKILYDCFNSNAPQTVE